MNKSSKMRPPGTATAVAAEALLPAPPPTPGEQSRPVAQLELQFQAEGLCTACCVALKPPGKRTALLLSAASGGSTSSGSAASWGEADVDEWLQSRLVGQGWKGWVCYNDAPPTFRPGSRFGHCKGILAWRTDRIGWLVHSVPDWPEEFSDKHVSPLPKSAIKNGQSFVWLSLPRSDALTKAVCRNLVFMNPCTFNAVVTTDEEQNVWPLGQATFGPALPVPSSQPPSCIQLAPGMWHLAKHGEWSRTRRDGRPVGLDFYEDALAQTEPFTGFRHVQTWLNGKANVDTFGPTASVDNILQMRLPDRPPHPTTKDHSKWAVHRDRDRPLVLIGDLNRTSDQTKRGGGGVVIEDEGLWQALSSLVLELEAGGRQLAASAQLQPPPVQLAAALIHTPSRRTAQPPRRTGASGASGSGLSALVGRLNDSLNGLSQRLVTAAAGVGADSAGGKSQVEGGIGGSSAAASTGNGSAAAGLSNLSSSAAAATASAAASVSSARAAAKHCSCQPQNCGRGKSSCKSRACSERCNCKGLCASTVEKSQGAQHCSAPSAALVMAAEEEAAAAAAAAAAAPVPAVEEEVAATAAAAPSAEPPPTPEPAPARAAAAPETPDQQNPVAAVAAGLGGLMQAAAMASALSAAAPAMHLLHEQQPATARPRSSTGDSSASTTNGSSACGSGGNSRREAAAGSVGGAVPAAVVLCMCSPGNCGRGRCGCKGRGHACSERCKCRGLCSYTARLAAAGQTEAGAAAAAAGASVGASRAGADGAAVSGEADADADAPASAAQAALPAPQAPTPVAALGAALQHFVQTTAAAAAAVASRTPHPQAEEQRQEGQLPPAAHEAGSGAELGDGVDQHFGVQSSIVSSGCGGKERHKDGQPAGTSERVRCGCAGGCRDRRCRCRRAGTACSAHCACAGCANCGAAQ